MAIAAYNSGDPYESLISQMVAIERQPQFALRATLSEQKIFKGVLSDFDRSLSELSTVVDSLTDPLSNPFRTRTATVPEGAGFATEATDDASPGTHTLTVNRLATNDRRVSKQFAAGGTELRSFFDTNGAQTFSVEVASPTDDEPDRRVPLSVTVEPEGDTDSEILAEIQAAIANAAAAAIEDGTLEADADAPGTSIVNETSATARLTLQSGGTGFANRLSFTDSADGLLGLLEVNAAGVKSGTGGGQITGVGTSEADSALNAEFELDGLTLFRSSNEVDDALEGVTLSLETTGDETSFRVGADAKSTREEVESFIQKYNAALQFMERKTKIDADAGTRGDFSSDASIRGLRFGMRNDLVQSVAGQPPELARLTSLGIEIQDNGTLKLVDPEALEAAAERDPSSVQRLFAAEDGGIGTKLRDRLDAFLGGDGILDARKDTADARIKRLDARIAAFDERLEKREEQLRQQFAKLQETLAVLQGQSQAFSSYYYGSLSY